MVLTEEQKNVVNHGGNARVIAVAGSGKTSTAIEYCRHRAKSPILYLAFNRSVREEAARKFREAGLTNVTVETAHSLAFRRFNVGRRFQLHPTGGYKAVEIVDMFGLAGKKSAEFSLALARHVLDLVNLFCSNNSRKLEDVDYLPVVKDPQSRQFARKHLGKIKDLAYELLKRMYQGQTPITHDGYLKFWSLTDPLLSFQHVLFDEAQDANGSMLEIVARQEHSEKVLIGDPHQSIYAFRHAINSLSRVDYPQFTLTNSFRFGQHIAELAMKALRLKALVGLDGADVRVFGKGGSTEKSQRAVIARGNLALLDQAISEMLKGQVAKPAFIGGISSYTYLSEGGSLFDILYLSMEKKGKIRDPFIAAFGSLDELKAYTEETDDREVKLLVELVEKYGPSLFDFIKLLRERQVDVSECDTVYSTVHRAKGLEFDCVHLTEDFITADRIMKLQSAAEAPPKKGKEPTVLNLQQLNEEINLLYVALTRSRNVLSLPFSIDPARTYRR